MALYPCPGCGALLPEEGGPVHEYMLSSPACWRAYGAVLAAEYADPALLATHRLSVDAYAVQHPGDPADRRAVQSVGLHLARLMAQLEQPMGHRETNQVMLDLGKRKARLIALAPPSAYAVTVADVAPHAGGPDHATLVRRWAEAAWLAWARHHGYIRAWAECVG